jgi:hypothetical protein
VIIASVRFITALVKLVTTSVRFITALVTHRRCGHLR